MKNKRIAVMTWTNVFGAGGMEGSILRLARNLSSNFNLQIDVLMLLPDNQIEFNPFGKNGITKIEHQIENVNIYKIGSWTGGTMELHRWGDVHRAVLELCGERNYALLHGFYASISGFVAAYAAREINLPSVISIRGCDVNRDVFNTGRIYHLKWALENSTYVTALSEELLKRANIISPCYDRGKVILNSIDPAFFNEGVQQLNLPHPLIGSLGIFRNLKGVEVLLCAFNMLLSKHPTSHLLLIGDVKPDEKLFFDNLVSKYNLSDRITITGIIPQRDVLRYLRCLDVFAFTSVQDACPNTVLEAMLAKIPVVATGVGAVPEMIKHKKNGLLVDVGSAESLCNGLREMLQDNKKNFYIEESYEKILTDFSPSQEAQSYFEIYDWICFQNKKL